MNLDDLMQQAKQIQERMQASHDAMANAQVTGEAGAGLVKVTITGKYDAKSVQIDPSLMQEDVTVVQDLVASAFNDAVRKVEKINKSSLENLANGIKLPEDFGPKE